MEEESVCSEREEKEEANTKKASPLWDLCSADNEGNAICNHCKVYIGTKYKGSEGKLERVRSHFNIDEKGCRMADKRNTKRKVCEMNPIPYGDGPPLKKNVQSLLHPYSFLSAPSPGVQREFNLKFARWMYITGTPFYKANNAALSEAISVIRPGITVPDRHSLAGKLLTDEYAFWKNKVDHVSSEMYFCTIGTDGWSTHDNFAFMNYMVMNDEKTLMIDGKFSGERKTAKYIAEELHDVIQRVGKEKVCGVVTDNAAPNKVAWSVLQRTYPKIFFYGCIAHTLHLFVKDLLKIEEFEQLEGKAKEIVKFFKSHQVEVFQLAEIQKEEDLKTLKLPGATRWGSLYRCFDSLLANKKALRDLVNSEGFIHGTGKGKAQRVNIKKNVCSVTLFQQFERVHSILKPVTEWLNHFQSDEATIADAFYVFLDLKKKFEVMVTNEVISEGVFTDYLWPSLCNRWNSGYADVHGLSYLLHPIHQGEGMDEENSTQTINVLDELGLMVDYAHYQAFLRTNNSAFTRQMKEKRISVRLWLIGMNANDVRKFPQLHEFLLRIYYCVPSSASCERNFSGFGYINTPLRNRLKKEKLRMLGYIYFNSRNVEGYQDEIDLIEQEEEEPQLPIPAEEFTLNFQGISTKDLEKEYERE